MRSDIDLACYHVVSIIQIPASVKLQVTLLYYGPLVSETTSNFNVPESIVYAQIYEWSSLLEESQHVVIYLGEL